MDKKLKGLPKNVAKTKTKDQLVEDYRQLFSTKVKNKADMGIS